MFTATVKEAAARIVALVVDTPAHDEFDFEVESGRQEAVAAMAAAEAVLRRARKGPDGKIRLFSYGRQLEWSNPMKRAMAAAEAAIADLHDEESDD